ncbi:MAG TPA: SBBP repeat-containing protein [bacterium]|nr:SBBP repeat-containing protein [bacterium]
MVCKLSLDYSTYLGGSDTDTAWAIAVDSDLRAYVAGQSWSVDFPTLNAYQPNLPGFGNIVVSKLSSNGSSLIYSTYLGGSIVDEVRGIAVDSEGSAYLGGYTISHDFPTVNPYQGALAGGFGDFDYFVTKLSSTGSALLYSTYLGGSDPEQGGAIAVDGDLCAYITGMTYSADFPTLNPYQGVLPGSSSVTVSKLSSSGSALVYSSFLGGSAGQASYGVAVDGTGHACIVGETDSGDFPTVNPYQASFNADTELDAFVSQFSSDGSGLVFSTYLGGSGFDSGRAIALDAGGAVCVAGSTDSDDFPTANAFQPARAGDYDAWVAKLSSSGSALLLGTYLGSSAADEGYGVTVDGEGRIYAVGETSASDFPLERPYRSVLEGIEAFVTCFDSSGAGLFYSTFLGGSGDDYGRTVAVDDEQSAYVAGFTDSTDFPAVDAFQPDYAGAGDIFVGKLSLSCYLTTPTPSATPTPSVTPTPSTTPSLTPTPTPSPTPPPTATPPETPTPAPTASATPPPPATPPFLVLASGDYTGDGCADVAVFRPDQGKWLVRGLGGAWFGREGDIPVPGDYDGNGVTDIGVYRPASGLWAVKNLTRFFLSSGLVPAPADYDGDGRVDGGAFRPSDGRWLVRNLTQAWYGQTGDLPVPADYDGDGSDDIAVWRPGSGGWLVRGLTRAWYGLSGDIPVPGYYVWDGKPVRARFAVYRPARGKWLVRDEAAFCYGSLNDIPVPGAFGGGVLDLPAVFRHGKGLWFIRGLTRAYFGLEGDYPVTR